MRSFLFTKLANVITVLTGVDAQGLSLLHPDVKVYSPKKDFPLPIQLLDGDHLVGRLSSEASPSVEEFLKDAKITQETLPQLDYNGFKSATKLREERQGHADENRSILRRSTHHAEGRAALPPIEPPRRSYSLTVVAPPSPQSQPPDSLSEEVHRSYSASLLNHALRHAGWDSPQ